MMPIFDEDSMDSKNTSMSESQHMSHATGGSSNGLSKAEIRKVNWLQMENPCSGFLSIFCPVLVLQKNRGSRERLFVTVNLVY